MTKVDKISVKKQKRATKRKQKARQLKERIPVETAQLASTSSSATKSIDEG